MSDKTHAAKPLYNLVAPQNSLASSDEVCYLFNFFNFRKFSHDLLNYVFFFHISIRRVTIEYVRNFYWLQ